MRIKVLLFGLLVVCFSANITHAQINGWPDAPECSSTVLHYGNPALISPALHSINEGGTSSFVFSWDPVDGDDFSHYYIFLFLEEPTDFDLFCAFKTYPVFKSSPMEIDFSHDIADVFGDEVEGRVWASVHTRQPRSGGGYDYSPVVDGSSLITAFWDNTVPSFSLAEFAEISGQDTLMVRGTSQSEIIFRGIIDDGNGVACSDPFFPVEPCTLFLDELDGFSFEDVDGYDNGVPYILLDSCEFAINLGIPSNEETDRKNLTVHLRDSALNIAEPQRLSLEYFQPLIAQAFPNPLNLRDGVPITIQVLGAVKPNTPVRIFGPFGHRVKDLSFDSVNANGQMASITWDGTNGQGQRVSTGAYLYVIEAENGKSITGKIAVVQ